jgi:hypothetical protein
MICLADGTEITSMTLSEIGASAADQNGPNRRESVSPLINSISLAIFRAVAKSAAGDTVTMRNCGK